jgi:hypothetical protein
MQVYEIFVRRFVLPRTYKDVFDRVFGEDWLRWEPETIRMEISRGWGVQPLEEVFEKIMALQAFLTTDLFWDEILPFEDIVLAFNDAHVDPDMIQQALPREIAFAITVAGQLSDKKNFVEDIIEYIQACHREEGVLVYHDVLKFAQPEYDDVFRKRVAGVVSNRMASGEVPQGDSQDNDPEDVQHVKTWDCFGYVQERLRKGAA